MNCPNCPSPLVCPEGGNAYCLECGWGTVQWWAKKYGEVNVMLGNLQKRKGELIDAILTHRRDTPPGASAAYAALWATVIDPVPYGLGTEAQHDE